MFFRIAAAFGLRWVARLSKMRGIIFPTQVIAFVQGWGQSGFNIAVEELAIYRPTITQGASSLSWRSTAMKVWVCPSHGLQANRERGNAWPKRA